MNKASQIVLLCEDRAHEIFVLRLLKSGWHVKPRAIRVLPYPGGKGSGKKYVEDNLAREAQSCRARHASTVLLVVRDADEQTVDNVASVLNEKIVPPRKKGEPIAFIIPKWHIQTWIAYLDCMDIDETDKETYKNKYGKISESKAVHAFVDSLAGDCRGKETLVSPPDSLESACMEFDRVRNAL
jgi:hypothetical protein